MKIQVREINTFAFAGRMYAFCCYFFIFDLFYSLARAHTNANTISSLFFRFFMQSIVAASLQMAFVAVSIYYAANVFM